jgi:hypothetical protein
LPGDLRTEKSLIQSSNNYALHGKVKRQNLKYFYNVEFAPLIKGNDNDQDTIILEKVPPPPLHLKLGAINALMKGPESSDPKGVQTFVKKMSLVKENYHRKNYEGNECNKILKNLNLLRKTLLEIDIVAKVIKAMKTFQAFSEACCGIKPTKNWENSIENFSQAWLKLNVEHGVSVPNKVHIIIDHVFDYISKTGKWLGRVTDQVVESCHNALNKRLTSSNYWVKNVDSVLHENFLF